mgnify:CR=1 FL=1
MRRDRPGLKVGPSSSGWGAHRRGGTHRDTEKRVTGGRAEARGTWPQLGLPGAPGSWRRWEGPSSEPLGSGHLACFSWDQAPSEAPGEPPSPSCHPETTEPRVMAQAWALCQPRGSQADRAEQGPNHQHKCKEPGIKKMGFEKLMSL